jgi:hypothetical protein
MRGSEPTETCLYGSWITHRPQGLPDLSQLRTRAIALEDTLDSFSTPVTRTGS